MALVVRCSVASRLPLDPARSSPASLSSSRPADGKGSFVRVVALLLVTLLAIPDRARAQPQPAPPSQPTRTVTTPAPSMPGTSSNPFLGGVPSGSLSADPLKLTILDAIVRALQHNLGVLTAEEALGRAGGARWIALS